MPQRRSRRELDQLGAQLNPAESLPHSPEAERCVLGAILVDNSHFSAVDGLQAQDFFLPYHREIFKAMLGLRQSSAPVDSVTLGDYLKQHSRLEQAGGNAYLATIGDGMPRVINVEHYARIMKESARRRRLAYLGQQLQDQALRSDAVADDVLRLLKQEVERFEQSSIAGWRETFSERVCDAQITFLADGFLPEGITFFGGLAESGKTWFALALSKALVTGLDFLTFRVSRPTPTIYLTPEVGNVSLSARLEKTAMPNTPLFLHRTQDARECFRLDDAGLLAAVRELKPVVVLDTLVRFSTATDENSATENQALAQAVFRLRREGARAVLAIHHQPKGAADEAPTLENTLRGTGDFGALADAVYHVRKSSDDHLGLRITPVKARDFAKPKPFEVQGLWPGSNAVEFRMLVERSEEERVRAAIEEHPEWSYDVLARRCGIAKSTIARLTRKLGLARQGNLWVKQ